MTLPVAQLEYEIVKVSTSPPPTYVPVGAETFKVVEPVGPEAVPQPILALTQGTVYVLEPMVTIQSVDDQAMEFELGLDIVIVYVKALVPEVTFFALTPTVGVLEVLVVKNPVRAR